MNKPDTPQRKPSSCLIVFMAFSVVIVFLAVTSTRARRDAQKEASTATTAPSTPTSLPDTATPSALIPGIAPADVKINLEQKGLVCEDVRNADIEGVTWYFWTCKKETASVMLNVDISSRSLSTVDSLDASVIQFADPSNDLSASFLSFVASIAFIGNDAAQTQAMDWVNASLPMLTGEAGDTMETVVNGVSLILFGPATARTLQAGMQ